MTPNRGPRLRWAAGLIAAGLVLTSCTDLAKVVAVPGDFPTALAGVSARPPGVATPVAATVDPVPPDTQAASSAPTQTPATPAADVRFAVIGDFGTGDANEAAVARLVASWQPQFIVGVGDIYYSEAGGTGTGRYDRAVGAFYCAWLKDIKTTGTACPKGTATKNAFFPALGNHDLSDAVPAPDSYLEYFTLPGKGFTNSSGNERYYEFTWGQVQFFVLNSNPDEPDGITVGSKQANWLKTRLAASTARWKIVVDHHPPFSSDNSHGANAALQWPFAQWGADAVLSGHSHTYERIKHDGIVYFVNGLGGQRRYEFSTPVDGSRARFSANFGAQSVVATWTTMQFDFHDVTGALVDTYTLRKE